MVPSPKYKQAFSCFPLCPPPLQLTYMDIYIYIYIYICSGGRPEGSKHNLKFQSAMWHHFKHKSHTCLTLIHHFNTYAVINHLFSY
jgi:hypothetical protein